MGAPDQRLVPVLFGLFTCLVGLGVLVHPGAPRGVAAATLAPIALMPPFLIHAMPLSVQAVAALADSPSVDFILPGGSVRKP